MGYLTPVDAWISATWADHRNRNPPSGEPGTDYAANYGTPVRAPWAGTVIDAKYDNSGAMGRYVTIQLDDGRATRSLHLAEVWAGVGTRVVRGQHIGASGGSGHGSDHGYGSHVHQTLWPGAPWDAATIDFELYVGPDEGDDDMPLSNEDAEKVAQHVWAYNNLTESTDTATAKAVLGQTWERAGKAASRSQDILEQLPDTQTQTGLAGPAWTIGVLLGLIGLVEVIRLVVDVLT